ncbi:trypsin-like serine protease with C-terminal PDZ domain [Thermus oshimai JL-2]|uniref:Trypsin-like serine protease with C-terminal PDZ domain n=1 Tax=Thermus oshimai JL-2 TaxID=751945 RepID=K7QW10_THEOS|nr:trypsin-like peptidase domain-containing protein [Thermus oshimai]AFV75588.1 trypsin-like serine protease with C-terminal PDZ domain [Thermus oshimai JL-2]
MSLGRSFIGFSVLALMAGAVLWWGVSGGQAPKPQTPSPAPDGGLLEYERNTVEIVERYGDGVVYVAVRTAPRALQLPPGFEFFAPFLQAPPQEGTGSGFVIDQEGYVLTNYHVVEGADQITVKFHNDPKEYRARLVGSAPPLDVALLKVEAPKAKLVPLVLGDSDKIRVGQKAIAMGNPFGLEFTVTQGIVSAIRENPGAIGDDSGLVPQVIQTDAAINPGNSGGPLLNSRGEVIGINTAIFTPTGQFGAAQFAGVGFALPINLVKEHLPELRAGKTLTAEVLIQNRPRLGVSLVPLSLYPERLRQQHGLPETGLMVQEVERNSPAERAGLKPPTRFAYLQLPTGEALQVGLDGDVLLEADGVPLTSIASLRQVLYRKKPGEAVTLKVFRGGRTLTLRVVTQVIR